MSARRRTLELTQDAIEVAKAFMDLDADDRREFKRAIELQSWLLRRRAFGQWPIRVRVTDARLVDDA